MLQLVEEWVRREQERRKEMLKNEGNKREKDEDTGMKMRGE